MTTSITKRNENQAAFWDEPIEPPVGTGSGEPMAQMFEFIGQNIRVVGDPDSPRFVLDDVAKVLGYSLAANAAKLLKPDQKGIRKVNTLGGSQSMLTCSYKGLYRLIIRSRSKVAEDFQDWVEDVIESIQKTGGFIVKDRTARWRKSLKCDQPTSELREGVCQANKDFAAIINRCEGKQPADFARGHDVVCVEQFGAKTAEMKKRLGIKPKKKDSLANHMAALPLGVQQLAREIINRKAQEVFSTGGKLTADQFLNGVRKVVRSINASTLEQLGEGYSWDVVENESRGKILDARRQLSSPGH